MRSNQTTGGFLYFAMTFSHWDYPVRVGKQLDRNNKRKAPTVLESLLSQLALIHFHADLTREQRGAHVTNTFSYTDSRFQAGVSAEGNAWQPETV